MNLKMKSKAEDDLEIEDVRRRYDQVERSMEILMNGGQTSIDYDINILTSTDQSLSPTVSSDSPNSNEKVKCLLLYVPKRLEMTIKSIDQRIEKTDYDAAIDLCKLKIDDLEQQFGDDHIDLSTMYDMISLLYLYRNMYNEAKDCLKKSLKIKKKVHEHPHPEIAKSYGFMAAALFAEGSYPLAEAYLNFVITMKKKVLGPKHFRVAQELSNLASTKLMYCDEFREIEKLYKEALDILSTSSDDTRIKAMRKDIETNLLHVYHKKSQKSLNSI